MKKISVIKLFSCKNASLEHKPSFTGENSYLRDWKIMVYVFAAGLIFISIFSWQVYLSSKIGGGYLTSDSDLYSPVIKTVDKKRLQNDILILENKQVDFIKSKADSPKIVDPSI